MQQLPRSLVTTPRPQIGIGHCEIGPHAKELVLEVLDSNRLSAGPMMARFEQQIATLHGCKHGLMCNSGTSALQIALAALKERDGWSDGDEVLVPALTFIASSNVILYNNLTPVFVDVEPDYYCLDPAEIERRITPRTRAIMPVHIGGLPCDMSAISEIARAHSLRVVEDSCEAMMVSCDGRPVGSFSDIACFSTYIAHIVSTGVGGICTTNDDELFDMLKSLMNHGRDSVYTRIDDDRDPDEAAALEIPYRRFSFVRLGHSFRATEMEAALGLAELEQHEFRHAQREHVVAQLSDALREFGDRIQLPEVRPGADHAWMFYPLVVVDPELSRDDLVAWLEADMIETRYLLPLISQPIYRQLFGNLDGEYPVAARLNETAFYIGSHPDMTDEDVEYVADSFRRFFAARA